MGDMDDTRLVVREWVHPRLTCILTLVFFGLFILFISVTSLNRRC